VPGVELVEFEASSRLVVKVGVGEVKADGIEAEVTGDEKGSAGAYERVED